MFSNIKNIEFPKSPLFTTKIRVRFSDVNIGNHLDYASLLEIVGNARAQFFKSHSCNELDIDGIGVIVKNLYVDYLAEGEFDELFEIKLYITDVKGTSVNMLFLVKSIDYSRDVAKIVKKLVFFDYQKRKICPVPNKFINMIDSSKQFKE